MSRTKIIAGCYGAAVCGAGAWLDSRGHDTGSQVFMVSMMALSTPVALAFMLKGLRQVWFWRALVCCVLLHLVLLGLLWSRLPFENGDRAIILAATEMLALTLVTAKVMDLHPSGRAAAAQFVAAYRHRKDRNQA